MAENPDKPLFVPLMTEHYTAFADGSKTVEFRRYGPRWNEKTCPIGRAVTLSKGYGRQHRLPGEVVHFNKQHGSTLRPSDQQDVKVIYGSVDIEIACIGIAVKTGDSV